METVLYTIKPSNLPSAIPLYQPVVDLVHTQDVDKVSGVIAQKLGYEKMVVSHVLQNLGVSLPELLAAGAIDLGFLTMSLGMSGTVTDPTIVYNATTAPLTIRTALKKKSNIVESVRSLIGLQKNPYVPKTSSFTGVISSRYEVDGFVPISSSYAITGNNISLTGKELYAFTSIDYEWTQGDGPSFLFDDVVSGTNTRIAVVNPYDISKTYNEKAFIKFSLWNPVISESVVSPTYRIALGGLELIPVTADSDLTYKTESTISYFKFNIDGDGDLTIQWKSTIEGTTFGAAVKIVEEQVELILIDNAPNPDTLKMWVGSGAIEKYQTMATQAQGQTVTLTGFRE